jgi:lycopene cyclase domain-containing protein
MSYYLYLNLAIIAFPLIFSFEKRLIKFYTKIKPLIISLFLIGIVFVGWDVFATFRGHWSFNPAYVTEMKLLGLPIEEILFFVTVPYSCLFVFEAILYFIDDKQIFASKKRLFSIIGILLILSAFGFYGKEYTFLAIISVGLTFLIVSIVNVRLFSSRSYWIYIFITLLLFLVFNYILTSKPVVQYSLVAITGFRITTIPIEDFFFNFSMLTNYLMVYLWASKNLNKKSTLSSP